MPRRSPPQISAIARLQFQRPLLTPARELGLNIADRIGGHVWRKGRCRMRGLKFLLSGLTVCAAAAAACLFPVSARAADHGDAPNVAGDQSADLGDTYVFLDPNDNTKLVLAMTFRGFIVPGEAVNFTVFDPNTLYRFEIENTGDARADEFIDVTFSP